MSLSAGLITKSFSLTTEYINQLMKHYWESSLKGAAVSPDRLESVLDQHKIPTFKTGRVIINLSGNSGIIIIDKIVYGVS